MYDLKSRVDKKCKIIGSGSIKSYEDIDRYLKGGAERSEAEDLILDGVMIGQAAIGNPWVFTPHAPSTEEIKVTLLRHLDYMMKYEYFFQEQMSTYD